MAAGGGSGSGGGGGSGSGGGSPGVPALDSGTATSAEIM